MYGGGLLRQPSQSASCGLADRIFTTSAEDDIDDGAGSRSRGLEVHGNIEADGSFMPLLVQLAVKAKPLTPKFKHVHIKLMRT